MLACPFGTLVVPFAVSEFGWVLRSFGFSASVCGWEGASLAVRELGCE